MNCKEFVRCIPAFLNKDLEYAQLKDFCEHTDSCPECKEELTIQLLISKGIVHLEAGDAFDLNLELSNCIAEAQRQLKSYRLNRKKAFYLELIGGAFAVASLVVLFL